MSSRGGGAGLRTRFLLVFWLPTSLLLAVGGFLLYTQNQQILEDQLGQSLAHNAALISSQVRADRVMALTEDDVTGEGSRTYRSLMTQLSEAQKAGALRRVLIVDRQSRALLDVGGGLPFLTEVPELLRDREELERVFRGEPTASSVFFQGNDGRFYKTGYAPFRDGDTIVGAVAIEGSAEFFGPLESWRAAFIVLSLLAGVVLFASAVFSARTLAGPIARLVATAGRIGRGDLSTPVSREPTKELGLLAQEIELMRHALESRDRQLTMMLGGIAHEVKNPLGGIELFSGLLDEEVRGTSPDLAAAASHVAKIRGELDYLKRIVDDFLAFAREQKLDRQRTTVSAVLQSAVDLLAPEASKKGVALEVDCFDGALEADSHLLISAVLNLVKNAIQVSTAGQRVHVSAVRDGYTALIRVSDSGPGIPSEQQQRIFEPFFTTKEKGSGLGLPLARKIIEAHGGSIFVDSKPGKTVFNLRLPLAS